MSDIIAHLKALNVSFQQYFTEDITTNYWVKIHFQWKNLPEDVEEKESFIEMTSDSSMKDLFEKKKKP